MDDPGERLIAALYDGVTSEGGWEAFLDACRGAIGINTRKIRPVQEMECRSTASSN